MSNKDWKGNRKSVFVTLGASNHSDGERQHEDYYATDPKAADILCDVETFSPDVWECACGERHLADRLEKRGYNVRCSDIVDRIGGGEVFDFLSIDNTLWLGDIITNPPFRYAQEFVEKALSIIDEGRKVAMFLRLSFLEGKQRKALFRRFPPRTVYVFSGRISCAMNGDFAHCDSSAQAYAWFVWVKGYKGETVVKWVN